MRYAKVGSDKSLQVYKSLPYYKLSYYLLTGCQTQRELPAGVLGFKFQPFKFLHLRLYGINRGYANCIRSDVRATLPLGV